MTDFSVDSRRAKIEGAILVHYSLGGGEVLVELHCGRRRGGDRRRRRPQQRHGGADSPDHDAGVALQVKLNLKPVRREAGIILRIDRLCEPRMSVCILNILNFTTRLVLI